MTKPRILFISRAYPPVVGGIENQNYELSVWLGKITPTKTLANRRGRRFLPLFAPYALLYALFKQKHYDVVLLGDGTLALVGYLLKKLTRKKVISVVHGLDINWDSSSLGLWYEKALILIYRSFWVKKFLPSLDKLISVGNETVRVGISLGIPEEKFVFIPNGVDPDKNLRPSASRSDLERVLKMPLGGKKVLVTTGRLAKRKGVAWFIRNVLPRLDKEVIYAVAGDGPDKTNILSAIAETGMEKRTIMLGYISDEERNILWNTADLFVQPNIKIAGDMEGFGLSVIEAASCNMVVLAARLEGLTDAIKDGQSGFLLESADASEWEMKIKDLLSDDEKRRALGQAARSYVKENYAWEKISQIYLRQISKALELG